jgi:hypothetical protein
MVSIQEVVFETGDGGKYSVLIASGHHDQECTCGANSWRVDDPPRVLRSRPAGPIADPNGKGHLNVTLEIICTGCGARSERELLTTYVHQRPGER